MSFFQSLENSSFTDWFLGSDSIWTYPFVLTLHTAGLAVLVGASVVIHLRLLDVGSGIPFERLRPLYRLVWGGFVVNLMSGLILFVTQAARRVVDPVFYLKLACIGVALWLGVLAKRRAFDAPVANRLGRGGTRWVAVAALASWTAAIVTGRLMAYLSH